MGEINFEEILGKDGKLENITDQKNNDYMMIPL